MIKELKNELSTQGLRLEETEELVEYYRSAAYGGNSYASVDYDGSFDYDEEDWLANDSFEEVVDAEEDYTQLTNAEVEACIEGARSGFEAAHLIEDEDGDKETDGKAEEEEQGIHEGKQDGFSHLSCSDTKEDEKKTQK